MGIALTGPSGCPDCGATWKDGRTCRSVFEEFLVLELTNAGYGAVHLLTVACYMIQHGEYSDEALIWIERTLRDFLEKEIPTDLIREQAAREVSQERRKWKVNRRPEDPPQTKRSWSMTIMDVALNYRDAESYRNLVKEWARTTLKELQALLPG